MEHDGTRQRRGRVGRVKDGLYIKLFSHKVEELMDEFEKLSRNRGSLISNSNYSTK